MTLLFSEPDPKYVLHTLRMIDGAAFDAYHPIALSDPSSKDFVECLKYIIRERLMFMYEFDLVLNAGTTDGFYQTQIREWIASVKRPSYQVQQQIEYYKKLDAHLKFPHSCFMKTRLPEEILKNIRQGLVYSYNIPIFETSLQVETTTDSPMAKKEKNVLANEPVKSLLLSQENANKYFQESKKVIDAMTEQALQIIDIETPEAASGTSLLLKDMNDVVKKVEALRKKIKQPFMDAGKLVDDTAKLLGEDISKQVDRLKSLLLSWDQKQAAAQAEKDRKAAQARAEEERKANLAIERINQQKQHIVDFELSGAKAIIDAPNEQALMNYYIQVLKPYTSEIYDEQLRGEADAMKNRLVDLGKARQSLFQSEEAGKTGNLSADALATARTNWQTKRAQYSSVASSAVAAIAEKTESLTQEVALTAEINKSNITTEVIAQVPESNIGKRTTWKYRVLDINKVPDHFRKLVPNEEAIEAAMKAHKAEIEQGVQGIPGIEFYSETTAVIR